MNRVLWIIFAGFIVRLAIYPLIDIQADWAGGDSGYYLSGASGFRPPLYSWFVSLFGPWVIPVQSAMTIGLAVAAYLVLRRQGETPAFLAGLLLASAPFVVFMEARVLSEVLYGALIFAAFLTLYHSKALWAGALAGALIGAAILTRDTLLVLPLFVLPFRLKQGLALCAVAYVIALPWYLSNTTEGRSGFAFWVGTWERNGDWQNPVKTQFPDYAFQTPEERSRLERAFLAKDDEAFKQAAIDRVQTQPLSVLAAWTIRYPRLWLGTRSDLSTLRVKNTPWLLLKAALWGLNLVLLALGFWALWRERRKFGLFAIPVAYVALIYIPFHNTETRYSLMALPFLLAPIPWALWPTLQSIHARAGRRGSH